MKARLASACYAVAAWLLLVCPASAQTVDFLSALQGEWRSTICRATQISIHTEGGIGWARSRFDLNGFVDHDTDYRLDQVNLAERRVRAWAYYYSSSVMGGPREVSRKDEIINFLLSDDGLTLYATFSTSPQCGTVALSKLSSTLSLPQPQSSLTAGYIGPPRQAAARPAPPQAPEGADCIRSYQRSVFLPSYDPYASGNGSMRRIFEFTNICSAAITVRIEQRGVSWRTHTVTLQPSQTSSFNCDLIDCSYRVAP